ncbi:type I pullulanase [Bifidobacterium tsurumiense]|uniref:Type II secretory pathway pullulanase PulA glycosidase n=1 Tax=Bifidobacterium tsurumiense TaxID=356829 RepID=A0A087EAX9_9BIFI|nr:type I pullulanase [Bifidobacterium tsurumiense]KFJ04930.1 type II secretory pathway pullulanase PulA glycosidase [Bifidobacterium tsurumiense]MDY4678667.1 type I pullulanase [Bifidobacterium tsurumiense]
MASTSLHNSIWPVYHGHLGAAINGNSTIFTAWSPNAIAITLRLFDTDDPYQAPLESIPMTPVEDGAWQYAYPNNLSGTFYDYLVEFKEGTVNRTSDPWAMASGSNGLRSMVVNLRDTDPEHWQEDRSPEIPDHECVIWETHIGDFSNDPRSGHPDEHRGKYLAFTDEHTTLDGVPGAFPTGIDYLKHLGVTYVQILPFFDYGSVDEDTGTPYNWGYDPVAYDVPEGSYSTNPHDGATRIRECKSMIAALHRAGMRVIMDVVYNHMYVSDNPFERMVPGYFTRRYEDGSLVNGSGCGNDMASERLMFRRFIVESLVHWAREYHIDGFRFDLMGLIDVETMNEARRALDELPGGSSILMYGEPWSAGPTLVEGHAALADKLGRNGLDSRIGWFSDESRDAIKGSVMDHRHPGFANGNAHEFASSVTNALNAWRGTPAAGEDVGQIIQYVSAHDDLTLWDKLCISMRERPSDDDYATRGEVSDILAANAIAAGLVLSSAGRPFFLSGEEFARTKYGCDNSFNQSAQLNWLDWSLAKRMHHLTDWYRTMIAIRKSHQELFDGARSSVPCDADMIAVRIGNLLVCANPNPTARSVSALERGEWTILADSTTNLGDASHASLTGNTLLMPARSFVVCEVRAKQ